MGKTRIMQKINTIKEYMEEHSSMTGIILFCVVMLAKMFWLKDGHNWGGDFSQYIAQARALASNSVSEWFQKNSFIINASADGLGADVYPWGYPVALSVLYAIVGKNLIVFKILNIIWFSLAILVTYKMLKEKVGVSLSFVSAIIVAFLPQYYHTTDSVIPDTQCMLFTLLAVYYSDKFLRENGKNIINGLLAGVFIFGAYFTRTQSLALIPALVLTQLIIFYEYIAKNAKLTLGLKDNYRKPHLDYFLPYIVFGILYFLGKILLLPSGGSYKTYFSIDIVAFIQNAYYYLEQISEMFTLWLVFLMIFSLVGICSEFKKEIFQIIFVAMMMAELCLYTYRQGTRFIWGIFPILFMWGVIGVRFVLQTQFMKYFEGYLWIFGFILFMIYFPMQIINTPVLNNAYSEDSLAVYEYINSNISEDKVVAFFKPRVLYLETGVYSYWLGNSRNPDQTADYYLLCEYDGVDQAMYENQEEYLKIFENETFKLYERKQ